MQEDEKIFFDSKARAEAKLAEEIHAITGSGITELVSVTESLFDQARVSPDNLNLAELI